MTILLLVMKFTSGHRVYIGTPGMQTLITEKNPKEHDEEDYKRYKEPIYETNVLYRDYDPQSSYPRANRSMKWKTIFHPIWEDFQWEGVVSDDEEEQHNTMLADGLYRTYLQKKRTLFQSSSARSWNTSHTTSTVGIRGDGLYLRMGSSIYNGNGLLLGPRIPFINLKWIL